MSTPLLRPSDSFEYLAVVIEFSPTDAHHAAYAAYELHTEPHAEPPHVAPPHAGPARPLARVAAQVAAVRADFEPHEEEFFAAGDALAHEPDPVGESFDDEPAAPSASSARAIWRGLPTT